MKVLLSEVGVPQHQLFIIPKEYKTKTLASAFDWLHNVYVSDEYAKVDLIYKSMPPEAWNKFKLLGVEDLTEQRLLLEEGKKLVKLWKTKRPRLFINRQKELCEDCEELSVFTYSDHSEFECMRECGNCKELFLVEL